MLSGTRSDKNGKKLWRKFIPRLRIGPLLLTFLIMYFAFLSIFRGKTAKFAAVELVKILEQSLDIEITYQQIGFYFKPSFFVKNLIVQNNRDELLLTCSYAEVSFEVLDLIEKKSVKNIFVDGLKLSFYRSENGSLNWNFDTLKTDESPHKDITFPKFAIEKILVTNSSIMLLNSEIKDISVSASVSSFPEGINVSIEDADFFTAYLPQKVSFNSDFAMYPDMRFSGVFEIMTQNLYIMGRTDFFSREMTFNTVIDTFWTQAQQWIVDVSGDVTGSGKFSYREELKDARFTIKAQNPSLGQNSIDSLFSIMSYEDGIVSSDSSQFFFGHGELFGTFCYALEEDSLNFYSIFHNLGTDDFAQLSSFLKFSFSSNGSAEGWIKNLKDSGDLRGEVLFSLLNSSLNGISVNSFTGSVSTGDGIYKTTFSCITEKYGRFTGSGDFSAKGYNVYCDLRDFNISVLNALELTKIPLNGTVNGNFRFDGRYIFASLSAREAQYQNITAGKADIELRKFDIRNFSADMVDIYGEYVDLGGFKADRISASANLTDGILQGSAALSSGLLAASSDFSYDEKISQLSMKGFEFSYDSFYINSNSDISLMFSDKGVFIDTFSASGLSDLELTASCLLSEGEINGFLNIEGIPLSLTSNFSAVPPLSGQLSLRSDFWGPVGSPVSHVFLRSGKIRSGQFTIDGITLRGVISKSGLDIDSCEIVYQEKSSFISGHLPFGSSHEIDLNFYLNDIGLWPLEFLSDIAVMLSGNVYGQVSLKGTYQDLDIFGSAEIRDGAAFVKPAGQIARDIGASAVFHNDSVSFKVTGKNSRGDFDIEGSVVFNKGYRSFVSDIFIAFREIDYTGIEGIWANVTGNLEIMVDSSFHSTVKGEAIVNQALISPVPESNQPENIGVEIPDLELFIDGSSGNIIFRHELAEVELSGTYNVSSFGNVIYTKGELTAERGKIFYLDRSFNITDGKLFLMTDSTEIDGMIDFTGETEVFYTDPSSGTPPETKTVTITARLSGNINTPLLTLSSEPKMSQQDIISLLTFNTTWSNISSISTITSAVPNRAVNYLLRTRVFSRLERALNLNVINLETGVGTSNSAKLTLAKYVTRNVYIEYKKDILNNTPADVTMTYRIWKNTSLFLNKDHQDIMGVGVQWIWRY